MLARVSKDRRASTSVETRPGTIFRISVAERDQQAVDQFAGGALAMMVARDPFQQRTVRFFSHRLQNQRRIRGGVGGAMNAHGFEIAGIGNYRGELAQGFELVGHNIHTG